MAKVKKTKTPRAKLSSVAKRNLFVVGVILIVVGLMLFVVDYKKQKTSDYLNMMPEQVATQESTAIGPSEGCKLIATNYVCDIKVTNPLEKPLEWSSVVTGIDGASLSDGGSGSVGAGESTIVQLTVPKAFCDTNPEGAGNVLILENADSSNQAETKFTCSPISAVSESPKSDY
jgi:hypothetical protein